jgi:hypothetical protein
VKGKQSQSMHVRTKSHSPKPRPGRTAVRHELSFPLKLDARLEKWCSDSACDRSSAVCDALRAYFSLDPEATAVKSQAKHAKIGLERLLRRAAELIVLEVCRLDSLIGKEADFERACEIALSTEAFAQLRADLIVAARQVAEAAEQLASDKSIYGKDAE